MFEGLYIHLESQINAITNRVFYGTYFIPRYVEFLKLFKILTELFDALGLCFSQSIQYGQILQDH